MKLAGLNHDGVPNDRSRDELDRANVGILGYIDLWNDMPQKSIRFRFDRVIARRKIGDHLPQWLYTVCRNAALNVRRKEGRMVSASEIQGRWPTRDSQDPAAALQAKESQTLMLKALGDLPENQREVVRLKFQHGMSYRQISAVTGRTTSYVGYLIHAGLKSIRQKLESGRLQDTGS